VKKEGKQAEALALADQIVRVVEEAIRERERLMNKRLRFGRLKDGVLDSGRGK
jgi:hypothetical protein